MTEKMMKFLQEAEKDAAFAEKVNTVDSLEALAALAKEKGYDLAAEDLKFDLPIGELDDAALDDVAGGILVGSAMAGSAVAGSAVAGSAVAGSAVAGSAVAGSAIAGSAVAGSAIAGSAVAGSSITSLLAKNLRIRFGLTGGFSGGISIDNSSLTFLGLKK